MIKINRIEVDDQEILKEIIEKKRENVIKINDAMNACYKTILKEEEKFLLKEYLRYNINLPLKPTHFLLKEAYTSLYTNETTPSGELIQKIYNNPKTKKCLYCGINSAKTIDHYLPKEKYSYYSIYSKNLIPCCSQCNSKKGATVFKNGTSERVFINFYDDDIFDKDYLKVKIEFMKELNNFKVDFYLENEAPSILKNHFKKLELFNRYEELANELISEISSEIKENNYAIKECRKVLRNKYNSLLKMRGPNNYEASLYLALAEFDDLNKILEL